MNKISNKKLLISLAATATVIAPLTTVISCSKKEVKSKTTKRENEAFTGTTIGQLVDENKNNEVTPVQTGLLSSIKEMVGETLYKSEQKNSIEVQKEDFQWQIYQKVEDAWKTAKELVANTPSTIANIPTLVATDNAAKKAEVENVYTWFNGLSSTEKAQNNIQDKWNIIDTNKKDRQAIEDKIAKVDTLSDADYKSSTFATDYPKIIAKLNSIKETQRKTYNETKDAFIASKPTQAEGQVAWETQRSSQYSGAKTDEEAIDQLVNNAISTIAFGRYKYALNSSFTVKQVKSGIYKQFKQNNNAYVFDGTEGYYAKDNGSNDDSKVYFLGTSTLKTDDIVVNVKTPQSLLSEALQLFADKGVIEVQHALIDIKSVDTGNTLPWTVTKDTITHLLSRYGDKNEKAFDLYKNIFGSNTDEANTLFLKHFSNNEDSTKEKQGNLGVNNSAYWIKNMDAGFGLGIVAAQAIQTSKLTGPSLEDLKKAVGYAANAGTKEAGLAILEKIQTDLEATLSSTITSKTDTFDYNEAMKQYIDNLSDDEFNKKYGAIFRDAFFSLDTASTDTTKNQLVYPVDSTKGIYLVRSSFGIHTIKITPLANTQGISDLLTKDLQAIADKDDTSASAIDWSTIFNSLFSDQQIVSDLLQTKDVIDEFHFDDLTQFKASHPDKYKKWVDNKFVTDGQVPQAAVKTLIDNLNHNDKINTSTDALTGKTDYVVGQMDKYFLNSNTIDPTTIYNEAIKEMGADK